MTGPSRRTGTTLSPARRERIVRWIEYIEEHPPEVWGPQQNAIVNSQLASRQAMSFDAELDRQVQEIADEIMEQTDEK